MTVRSALLLLSLLLLACPPVRDSDDDDATGSLCPDGVCVLTVADPWVDCGPEPEPLPEDNVLLGVEDGVVTVTHFNFAQGCCPQVAMTASLEEASGDITVDYGLFDDFCDCICSLDASFSLTDVPPGSWVLVLPGGTRVDLTL